jgi:16S rRNA (cytosine967-C5)-methyltransferase
MTLRVNLSRVTRGDYIKRLAQTGVSAAPVEAVPSAVVLDQPVDASALPGFAAGMVSVQDAGAQLAAGLLDLRPGQRVLDTCAAPGGKTGHLLEVAPAGVTVTALDVDAGRQQRLLENLKRLRLTADVQVGDAAKPDGEWAQRYYDRILMDVPCSATGVIRRHPDIKWLRRPGDIPSLAAVQARILDAIWPLLKPGGMLLYATCSLLPEENQLQMARCLESFRDAHSLQIEASWGHSCGHGRQTLPGEATMDGFYYARLQKAAT